MKLSFEQNYTWFRGKAVYFSCLFQKLNCVNFSVCNCVCRFMHENIVKLLAFSSDGPELCLIYEHTPGGTLSDRLRSEEVIAICVFCY